MDKRQTRIKELQKEINKLDNKQKPFIKERNKLQEQISLEANKKFLGKCFKVENSYGSSKKWLLYSKVVGVDDYSATVIKAQDDGNGRVEIMRESHSASYYLRPHGLTEITEKEFEEAFNKILGVIKKNGTA